MNKHEFQIPIGAKPGEIWFFVNLSRVTSHTPDQLIERVTEMGYTPQLRCLRQFINGEPRLDVALLLHQGQVDPATMPEELEEVVGEKLITDWEMLATDLQPSTAVSLRVGRDRSYESVPDSAVLAVV